MGIFPCLPLVLRSYCSTTLAISISPDEWQVLVWIPLHFIPPFHPPHTISSGSYLTSYDPPAGIDRSDNSVISRWIGLDIYVSQVSLLCSFSYFC